MGVNLYLDDKGFVPTDVNGNETYPFISEGTTYVPIRAIASLFNADIIWDEKTNSAYIGTSGERPKLSHTPRERQELYDVNIQARKGIKLYVNGQEVIPTDVNGNKKDIYEVNGTTYVPVRAVSNALGLPITWSDKTNSVFIGKHKTEGLTVENINDPEAFRDAVQHFFRIIQPLSWSYEYKNKSYDIIENNLQEFAMAIALANLDYCSDQLLVEIFPNLDSETIDRLVTATYAIGYPLPKYNNIYDFKYITVDHDCGEFLEFFQNICSPEYREKNPMEAINFILDYYNDSLEGYDYPLKNTYIVYLLETLIFGGNLTAGTPYHDTMRQIARQDYQKYGCWKRDYICQQLIQKFSERYYNALENVNSNRISLN